MINEYQNYLPEYNKFKKRNTIIIKPPIRKEKTQKETLPEPVESKKGLILNDSKYENEIKYTLRQISNHHISRFESICDNVILNKYEAIYSQIFNYMEMLSYSANDFFHAMIINTDQNSSCFFEGLGKFLYKQQKNKRELSNQIDSNKLIIPKGESHFKDLPKLFQDLNLGLDFDDNIVTPISRLIVIGEIQRIDQIALNIFLRRLIEYEQLAYRQYHNILVFDVAYDPRNLLDKIKANILSKMILHQIDNVPSKNIYKEVLYKYIYEQSNCLFIPNSKNTKIIVDYINNHQISISSFQHSFKFSILTFFLMHSWDDDEYLLFSNELENIAEEEKENEESKAKMIKQFFKKKLKNIYGKSNNSTNSNNYNQDDIDNLVTSYNKHYNNKSVFFEFYQMFENIIFKLTLNNKNDYEPFDKFQFFFEFLQYDYIDDSNKRSSRILLIEKYIKKFPKADYTLLINEYILPDYRQLIQKLEKNKTIDTEIYTKLTSMIKQLELLGNEDIENFHPNNDDLTSIKETRSLNGFKSIHHQLITTKEIFNRLLHWFELLFTNNIFDMINDFDKELTIKKKKRKWLNSYKNYFDFSETVNPSLGFSIMKTLCQIVEETIQKKLDNTIKEKFDFLSILMVYIDCFKKLGSTFRLKLFFIEFLSEMDANIEINSDNEMQKQLKTIFIYVSYAFCLIGFFSKKKGMGNDVYMKNYFAMPDYYIHS